MEGLIRDGKDDFSSEDKEDHVNPKIDDDLLDGSKGALALSF